MEPANHLRNVFCDTEAIDVLCRSPLFPENAHPDLVALAQLCWDHEPTNRPTADVVVSVLKSLLDDVLKGEHRH